MRTQRSAASGARGRGGRPMRAAELVDRALPEDTPGRCDITKLKGPVPYLYYWRGDVIVMACISRSTSSSSWMVRAASSGSRQFFFAERLMIVDLRAAGLHAAAGGSPFTRTAGATHAQSTGRRRRLFADLGVTAQSSRRAPA